MLARIFSRLSLASPALTRATVCPRTRRAARKLADVGRFILAPDENATLDDLALPGGGLDLLASMGDTLRGVVDREWVLEDIAVPVAAERDMFALGVGDGDTEGFARRTGPLEDGSDLLVLVAVDGLD